MKKLNLIFSILGLLFLFPQLALAQSQRNPCYYTTAASPTDGCTQVSKSNPLPVAPSNSPAGTSIISGNASGTTGAVVGTLAAAANKITYICGFNVSAVNITGATAQTVTIAGIVGASQVYQFSAPLTTPANPIGQTFTPCIPSSAVNTAITITTSADANGSAVDVNSWGFQQ
jgi:hypothetical protein